MEYTKDKARMDVVANKEGGAFEAYRLLVDKALNISDERALDVEAAVFNRAAPNPRKTLSPHSHKRKRMNQSQRT